MATGSATHGMQARQINDAAERTSRETRRALRGRNGGTVRERNQRSSIDTYDIASFGSIDFILSNFSRDREFLIGPEVSVKGSRLP